MEREDLLKRQILQIAQMISALPDAVIEERLFRGDIRGTPYFRFAPTSQLISEYRLPKFFRCTNRKRFIKLLMSCGCSRSNIQESVDYVEAERMTYQDAWREFVFGVYSLFSHMSDNLGQMD